MRFLSNFSVHVSSEKFVADIAVLPCFNGEETALRELLNVTACWIQDGQRTALNVLSAKEKTALIQYVRSFLITPFNLITSETLSMAVEDFLVDDEGYFLEFSEEESVSFAKKLLTLSAPEALALVLWAKKFWSKDVELEEYIA